MSQYRRKNSNGPVDQMIENMTSDVQSADGQYIQLGFTPPQSPVSGVEGVSWKQPVQNMYMPHFGNEVGYPLEQPCYVPQAQIFNQEVYGAHTGYQNGSSDAMFAPGYNLFVSQTENPPPQQPTHIIDNLVNWAVPNTTGTYSPFGSTHAVPKINSFEPTNGTTVNCNGIHASYEEPKKSMDDIHFGRDLKKPRVVAQVKPMRPSYSDVLTKPVPQNTVKTNKIENKENKPKRDSKKGNRNEKTPVNSVLNRSNTNSDIKDIPIEKNSSFSKSSEKNNVAAKPNKLNRKWVSLDNMTETDDDFKPVAPKTKKPDELLTKNQTKTPKKNGKSQSESSEPEVVSAKPETSSLNKSGIKKGLRGSRQRNHEGFGSERPSAKRGQRMRKRDCNCHVPFGVIGQKVKQYIRSWWKYIVYFVLWLVHLISDICSLSIHLGHDVFVNVWKSFLVYWSMFLDTSTVILQRISFTNWLWHKLKRRKQPEPPKNRFPQTKLQNNINMPTTGEEAMKRLLACKGKDPYSILGVVPNCTDDDIKRYYKRQAFLVHPDKNQQPGAEEAFKILVHAFDMIGEPERRAAYDRGVAESAQVEQAWTELTELITQLQQKVEAAANTIRCSACNQRHKRVKVERPSYAARNCSSCKIHHSAREGDIWAEARCFGFLWHYYACMEGGVYDITEWAGCQKDSLKHLRPDSHHVQYRIALGKQNNQPRRHSSSPRNDKPDLEDLLNSLYGENLTQNARRKPKKTK